MRILRLKLQHFRGIRASEEEFARSGVTIVEGPNESGKSSMAEAIDLLFGELDSTRKRDVEAVRPVDRDVGTLIEADVVTGDYAFTYTKRFFKDRATVLRITAPAVETLRGREAHERAREILAETIDVALWEELRIHQRAGAAQPELARAPSLARALDEATGTEAAGDRESTLFDRAYEEYRRYFTPTGRPGREVAETVRREREAAAELERDTGELAGLERDLERGAELADALGPLEHGLAEARRQAEHREQERQRLEKRLALLDNLELKWREARLVETVARNKRAKRQELAERARATAARREELRHAAACREPRVRQAEEERTKRLAAEEAAAASATAAEQLLELRESDFHFHRDKLDLTQLGERRDRIERARKAAAKATRALERIAIDDAGLKALRAAHVALERARARLEADSPRLRLEALDDLELEIDGGRRSLARGEQLTRSVSDDLAFRLPDRLAVELSPGASTAELVAERDRVEREVRTRLDDAGVSSIDEAERHNDRRKEAQRTLDESRRIIEENLRDLTRDELDRKIERLEAWVSRYAGERGAKSPPPAAEFDEAAAEKRRAKQACEEARAAAAAARTAAAAAESALREARDSSDLAGRELEMARRDEERAKAELAEARKKTRDAALEAAFAEAGTQAAAAAAAFEEEKRALDSANSIAVRELATQARKEADAAALRLRAAQDERREIAARLELLGERGLFERRELARARHAHERRARTRMETRAAAARRLFEALRNQRERARRAYVGPLRQRVRELCAPVFGADFDVELNDDLQIVSRTLDGKTLPFSELSAGAREQIPLALRLAGAMLVAADGGAPLLFDDALGNTDPERITAIARMLAEAGRQCQIIVFTCTPGRFPVEGARIVRLGETTPVAPPKRTTRSRPARRRPAQNPRQARFL